MTTASVTYVHANSIFIEPHLEMLKDIVDYRIVVYGTSMWPPYLKEHGKLEPDNTRDLIYSIPDIEVFETDIVQHDGPSFAALYNLGIVLSKPFDYSMRMDVDMFLTKEDRAKLKAQLQQEADVIRLNHATNSINYYVDYDHGLMDAKEHESLAISTKNKYTRYLEVEKSDALVDVSDIMVHHFRGWNKPKTCTKAFFDSEYAKQQLQTKQWLSAPQEIRDMLAVSAKPWLDYVT